MRWIRFALLLFLFQHLFAASSFATPEETQALTISWQSLKVVTTEGVDVALAVIVNGASANQQIDIDASYGTWPGSASSAAGDYQGINDQTFKITGLNRVYIITIDVNYNNYYESYQDFKVELRSSDVDVVNGNQATVGIYRSRIFNAATGVLDSCLNNNEPANDAPAGSASINTFGGWCYSDFANEVSNDSDYYQFTTQKAGSATITLENTSGNQHDFNLYLYVDNGGGNLEFLQQSANLNQLPDSITRQLENNKRYVVRIYWVTYTSNVDPTYRLNVDMP